MSHSSNLPPVDTVNNPHMLPPYLMCEMIEDMHRRLGSSSDCSLFQQYSDRTNSLGSSQSEQSLYENTSNNSLSPYRTNRSPSQKEERGPPTCTLSDIIFNRVYDPLTLGLPSPVAQLPLKTPRPVNWPGKCSINEHSTLQTQKVSAFEPNSFIKHGNTAMINPADHLNWITVYGFAADDNLCIVKYFALLGDIIETAVPDEDNHNWIHLKFASRLQLEMALRRNGTIFGGHMVGVRRCGDLNLGCRVGPIRCLTNLSNFANKSVMNFAPYELPHKTDGFLAKAMSLILGW